MAARRRRVVVNDRMQKKYLYYCTEPAGRNFDPAFKPELTPKEMLELVDASQPLSEWRRRGWLHWAYDSRKI